MQKMNNLSSDDESHIIHLSKQDMKMMVTVQVANGMVQRNLKFQLDTAGRFGKVSCGHGYVMRRARSQYNNDGLHAVRALRLDQLQFN